MKSHFRRACLTPLFIAFFAWGAVPASEGAVILTIDITNPAQAVFSATGAFAQNDDLIDGTWVNEGFTLLGFFNSPTPFAGGYYSFDDSSLYSPGAMFAYTDLFVVDLSGSDIDLNIAGSSFRSQDFSTSAPAFTGFAIVDLTEWLSYITPGTIGDIRAGDNSYSTVIIGQFQVIPEPTVVSLLLPLAGLLCGHRRFRGRKAS